MGLGAVRVSAAAPNDTGFGARAELRIMPAAWRYLAPYASATGIILYIPGNGDASVIWSPAVTAGLQFSWRQLSTNLDFSWAFNEYSLTDESSTESWKPNLAGPAVGLTISFRL